MKARNRIVKKNRLEDMVYKDIVHTYRMLESRKKLRYCRLLWSLVTTPSKILLWYTQQADLIAHAYRRR